MLSRSVGYPADIETLPLPAWQRARIDQLLRIYTSDGGEEEPHDLRL
jgi:hypothetical protein